MTGAHQACDRLDAQQKEIERLKAENEMRVTDAVRNQQEAKRACGQWSDTVDRLEHEIETLTAENMSREKRIAFLEEDRDGNQKQIDDLTAENKAQAERIEKLKRFGRHIKFPRCEWFVIGGHCTCGWEEISKEQP
jgi:chromosome segregation ATPase